MKRLGCFSLLCLIAFGLVGCATQQPLPYAHGPAKPAAAGAPVLALGKTADQRPGKSNLDEMLDLPNCLDVVVAKELANGGLFKSVESQPDRATNASYHLQCTLRSLEWEVPDYKSKVGTAFTVSLLTGGIGGIAYGSTSTEVYGRAKMRFLVSEKQHGQVLLDREYSGAVTEKKTKLNCDTPDTCREVAAKAFQQAFEQFKADLAKVIPQGIAANSQ